MTTRPFILWIVAAFLGVVFSAWLVLDASHNVTEARSELTRRLAEIPDDLEVPASPKPPFDEWRNILSKRPEIWDALTEPPAPPPPPKPKPPEKPKLAEMLKGVRPLRAQVGQKVKIITPEDQKGSFYGIGDKIKGCTIKAIDKKTVTFSYDWKEGKQELTHTIERE